MNKIIENIGSFYLGKIYGLDKDAILEEALYYDANDLCTHAVCLGMTGSGKTGLCLSVLEEAMLDQIPIIAIDPKGDLSNLALNSPDFDVKDYQAWVDPGKAQAKGLDLKAYASKEAQKWREGTQAWQQDSKRLQQLKNASNINIYTPGSDQGLKVSVLKSFDKPKTESMTQLSEYAGQRIESLLSLMGEKIEAQTPEFVFLTSTLLHLWNKQRQVSLSSLIREIQAPSQNMIGVMSVDQFINEKTRMSLAMKINALLASPSFSLWNQGAAMDIQKFLWDDEGKPQVSIFSIAHLSDDERMFFVSTLLNEVTHWMRQQTGTSSLRALLYMDEIFGFLPPVQMPPSKKAFLTLLKQARAYGLGLMLASQNPADLDYKALSNIGTWFLGRLQTKQDQNKVIEGLETLSDAENAMTKDDYQSLLGKLPSRVFIMKNIHEKQTQLFHTRWAMSYLKGPLTLDEINLLMKNKKNLIPQTTSKKTDTYFQNNNKIKIKPNILGIKENYILSDHMLDDSQTIEYIPTLSANISALYQNNTYEVSDQKKFRVTWFEGEKDFYVHDTSALEFNSDPEHKNIVYQKLSSSMLDEKKRNIILTKFKQSIYNDKPIVIFKDDISKLTSKSDEDKSTFISRLDLAYKEIRDEKINTLKESYAKKIQTLENKKLKSEQKVEKEHAQYDHSKLSTAISLGSTLLGALLGRKITRGSVGKLGTTLRSAARIKKEKDDILMAQEDVEKYAQELSSMDEDLKKDLETIAMEVNKQNYDLKEVVIRPSKSNIIIEESEVLWVPTINGEMQIDLS